MHSYEYMQNGTKPFSVLDTPFASLIGHASLIMEFSGDGN